MYIGTYGLENEVNVSIKELDYGLPIGGLDIVDTARIGSKVLLWE